jgi:hypothetical protein
MADAVRRNGLGVMIKTNATATVIGSRLGYYYDGGNAARVPTSAALRVGEVFTLSAWVYLTDGSRTANLILGKADYNTDTYGYELFVASPLRVGFYVNGAANGSYLITGNNVISLNKWHHIVAVARGVNNPQEIWVNGQLVAQKTQTFAPSYASDYDLGLGAYGSAGFRLDRSWIGYLSECKIINRALSAAEIRLQYRGLQ